MIVVIYTGGTFGMEESAKGLEPLSLAELEALLEKKIPKLARNDIKLLRTDRLIDSSQATIPEWNNIGAVIDKYYDEADGFIVIHGTDTMDYLSAGLDCMFEGLRKPVVCTGSMKPLTAEGDTDASANFELAIETVKDGRLTGVLLAFGGKVFEPDTVFKYTTEEPVAFHSVVPPLVDAQDERISTTFKRTAEAGAYRFSPLAEHYIPFITFTPGNSDPYLQCDLARNPSAIVLEGLGNGNIPETARPFIEEARRHRIPVFSIAGPPKGRADSTYAAGNWAHDLGVESLGFMPRAACIMKLQSLLSKWDRHPVCDIQQAMHDAAEKLDP